MFSTWTPRDPTPSAYWWIGDDGTTRNLGDLLAPVLLAHFAGFAPTWAQPKNADLVTIGSVLDVLPAEGWTGVVAGSGALLQQTKIDLTKATVLGLRGKLSASQVKMDPYQVPKLVLGDPGLLAPELVTTPVKRRGIGVVPHVTDNELFPKEWARAKKYGYTLPHFIDVTGDPLEVIQQIAASEKIVASALHGAVVADAFGIPRRLEKFPLINDVHQGGTWKFADHNSAVGLPLKWHELQKAPEARVAQIQSDLFNMFRGIAARV